MSASRLLLDEQLCGCYDLAVAWVLSASRNGTSNSSTTGLTIMTPLRDRQVAHHQASYLVAQNQAVAALTQQMMKISLSMGIARQRGKTLEAALRVQVILSHCMYL